MKKMLIFTLLLFFTFANYAFAHTGLESSTPQDGEVIIDELRQITLTFESKIEESSTFELQHTNGKSISVENISISEKQLIGHLLNPLDNGEYQVNWKIIGADGHPIDGAFSFSVNRPEMEAPAEEENKIQSETHPEPNVEKTEEVPANETKDEYIQQNKLPSFVIPTIIGALLVIVVVSFLLMMKRKK